uniref:Kelch repeat protein n=1 Tax=Bionectria ochroleuca TaxID=29856 RepID=A0A8H7N549_BIOOC
MRFPAKIHQLVKMPANKATWTRIVSSASLDRSSQAASIVGNKLYIFGGELQPRQPVDNKIHVIDLAQGSDPTPQSLETPSVSPSPRVGSPSTTANGKTYLFSGRGGLEMTPLEESGALWSYDPSAAEWSLISPSDPDASFPAGRSYHCVASDGADRIFVHAGCPETGRLSDLWAFDLAGRTWTQLPSAPGPARGGASIAFAGGRLYRAWSSTQYKADQFEGPEARSVATLLSAKVQGKSYLVTMFGERDPSPLGHAGAGKMLKDIWVYDIEQGKWNIVETEGDAPVARGWFDADVTTGAGDQDDIVVHGGLSDDNTRLGDVWRLSFI